MEFDLRLHLTTKMIALLVLSCLSLTDTMVSGGPQEAGAAALDGITIIKFDDEGAKQSIASGTHLVTFISARGSFAAVVTDMTAHRSSCTSLAVPKSYSGTSIAFGMDADATIRRQALETYCPPFTLAMEDANGVRVKSAGRFSTLMKIVVHIPLVSIDFNGTQFVRHNLKGARLGPVMNTTDLSSAVSGGGIYGPRYRGFQHRFIQSNGKPNVVGGRAALSEITGWPVDVLYYGQLTESFPETSPFATFLAAVLEKYGEPSNRYRDTGYMQWFYDLTGQKINLATSPANSCRRTLEFRLEKDPQGRVHGMNRNTNDNLNFWGCSLVMELTGNPSGGGVTTYGVKAYSGYVMAIDHFHQQLLKTEELKKKIEALQTRKPSF